MVEFHFTCRTRAGEVWVSTEQSIAKDDSLSKAAFFIARDNGKPVRHNAGTKKAAAVDPLDMAFEDLVSLCLAEELVGMREGEKIHVELRPEATRFKRTPDQVLKIARIRKRPKEMRMPVEQYKTRAGKDPAPGQSFVLDPALPGEVASVTEREVVITFRAQPGSRVETPFGPGVVEELEDHYSIVIEARKGSLVRSGPYVGVINDVDEQMITIDYGIPFAGEALSCDVSILGVSQEKSKAEGSGS